MCILSWRLGVSWVGRCGSDVDADVNAGVDVDVFFYKLLITGE